MIYIKKYAVLIGTPYVRSITLLSCSSSMSDTFFLVLFFFLFFDIELFEDLLL